MHEGSSRYVDELVVSKILRDKLTQVHHAPPGTFVACYNDEPFADFARVYDNPPSVRIERRATGDCWSFESPVRMKYLENAHAIMHSHLVASPIANVLLTHGLFDDNRELYRFLISVLNEYHIDVYELILPYHYERTPARSKFSGEYFWSANVVRAADAIKQSVYEIALAERFIRERTALPVLPVGFSMGGGLTLLALSICPEIARAFVINPVSLMARLAWENPLCRSIREDLQGRGWDFPQVARVFRPFEPLNDLSAPLGHKVVLARGIYDQIIKSEDYELLNQYLRPSTVHEYHAGHISILRVPRLGMNIAEAVQTTLS